MKLKAIIIDDESAGRNFLNSLINEYIESIEVVGTATSALEGAKLLQSVKIDVIFLDVEMPNGSGFDFMDAIDHKKYKIILTTAYKDFAIKAFKYNVFGYLLKPIDIDDLEEISSRLLDAMNPIEEIKRIAFRTAESIEYIDPSDIIRVETEGNYATIYFISERKLVVSKNMKQIEELLTSEQFIKTHKSNLVNKSYIKRYIKQDGGEFEMIDGSTAPLSRRNREEILKKLQD